RRSPHLLATTQQPNQIGALTILRHWDDRPSAAAVVLTTGIGILFLAMTLLWSAITVSNLGHDNPAVPVGCLGVAILAAGAASLAGSRLLFLSDRIAAKLAPPVTARTDPAWGPGIGLVHSSPFLPLTTTLAGCALYGLMAWLSWRSGTGSELLPIARDTSGGATVALVFSIGATLGLLLMIFRSEERRVGIGG